MDHHLVPGCVAASIGRRPLVIASQFDTDDKRTGLGQKRRYLEIGDWKNLLMELDFSLANALKAEKDDCMPTYSIDTRQ